MRYPWVNVALLILLGVQLITGFLGLINGSESRGWILRLHDIAGYALVAILAWKGAIIFDVFSRSRWRLNFSRLSFIILTLILLGLLATGLIWTYAGPVYLFGFSLMTMHALLAIALVLLLAWHVFARQFILRVPQARDRRAFLRLASTGLAGLVLWRFTIPVKAAFDLPGATRRFTGSYETGSFTGRFPVVSWFLDYPPPVNIQRWRLVIDGAVERPLTLTYEQLKSLAGDTAVETIDCTGGWYSTQEWYGVRVGRLLDMAGVREGAGSVTVEAVSGYGRRFSVEEVRGYLLATQVAGETLSHGHGFPARLVASGHRGFDWVKWVTRIRVNKTGKLWQPPVPLR